MENKNKMVMKSIALFQIILMLTLQIAAPLSLGLSFNVYNQNTKDTNSQINARILLKALLTSFIPNVKAQDDLNEVEEKVFCCERTKDGASCQTAGLEQCDRNYNVASGRCEDNALPVCILGCFVKDGICHENVPQGKAEPHVEKGEASFYEGQACSEVPECEKGCCILGTEVLFVSEEKCNIEAKGLGIPEEYVDFRRDIENEAECLALKPEAAEPEEEVLPEEAFADCTNTFEADGSRGTRKTGESWCIYDAIPKNGTAPLGAIHYRAVCKDGKQEIFPCADARQEVCVQEDTDIGGGETFSQAACVPNRWRECLAVNEKKLNLKEAKEACESIDGCYWFNAPKKGELADWIRGGEDPKKPLAGFEQGTARCLPQVPTGFNLASLIKGEEGAGSQPINPSTICSYGSYVCKAERETGALGGLFGGTGRTNWECVPPERVSGLGGLLGDGEATEKEIGQWKWEWTWAKAMNERCMALGDCGA